MENKQVNRIDPWDEVQRLFNSAEYCPANHFMGSQACQEVLDITPGKSPVEHRPGHTLKGARPAKNLPY